MSTHKEKLSILSEMIAFAKLDKVMEDSEYNFLLGVASNLGVEKQEFDSLFNKKVDAVVPKSHAERILQFHRLVLLMNVDSVQSMSETNKLHSIGLKMGLPPSAIDQVLIVMHNYPNKVVPPNVLIDIFKAYYN
ncbi:putative tellurite resistance protein B-like protein [Saonia flava]|uniref:Putative tellurite resistance protein B-like protein n=1 Tax=Saonia flava TaxID=523696 RepID=A0A846R4Z8_9FLAO|nr:TerB family tellurite resistance protein [Saonia flava]NJB72454.1 putative tellurite resistance protein B-like protein [Saonia flava]